MKGQQLIEKEAVETGKVRRMARGQEGQHNALAQSCKTLAVAQRSQLQLSVAPLQPSGTEGDSAAWSWWPRWPWLGDRLLVQGGGRRRCV